MAALLKVNARLQAPYERRKVPEGVELYIFNNSYVGIKKAYYLIKLLLRQSVLLNRGKTVRVTAKSSGIGAARPHSLKIAI